MDAPPIPDFGLSARHVYDAEAVDEYIASLQSEIDDLRSRLADPGLPDGVEALLGRTMLMAQRAADEAISDALHRAEAIAAQAHAQADAVVSEANRRASQIIEDAQRAAANSPNHHPSQTARSDRDREAQRIIDEAKARIDAIFASARRSATSESADDRRPSVFAPSASSSRPAAPIPDEDDDAAPGRIFELRPDQPHGATPRFASTDRPPMLRATGTDNLIPAAAPQVSPMTPRASSTPSTSSTSAADRPSVSGWRERWRVARGGAVFTEGALARADHLDSLTDGSYVDGLRDAPAGAAAPTAPHHVRRSGRWQSLLLSLLHL